VLGWPKRCKLAYSFLWDYSYRRLKLAQLLGQLGVFLTLHISISAPDSMPRTSSGPRPWKTWARSHCRLRNRGTEHVTEY
jgi:hypothetical protein